MDAHIANETKFQLNYGVSPRDRTLVHLIIPTACLVKSGIVPTKLIKPTDGEDLPTSSFKVITQTRYHASGKCTPWESTFGGFIPNGAITNTLVPTCPRDHPYLFRVSPDPGGLFITLEIYCDVNRQFDPFNIIAIRLEIPNDRKTYELLFTYDELLPPGTRYGADASRLTFLCKNFSAYTKRHPGLPDRAVVAGANIEACMGDDTISNHTQSLTQDGTIDALHQLVNGGGFDTPTAISRLEDTDREIMSLIRRASEAITTRHPVRRVPQHQKDGCGVASGLRQGAIGISNHKNRPMATGDVRQETDALLSGLEPRGSGRFIQTSRPYTHREENPENLLIISQEQPKPLTPLDWLDIGHVALLGGDTPSDVWRRRPISLVARRHYITGETFVVVSYENSIAWGGRRAKESNLDGSLIKIISAECLAHGINHPRDLQYDVRKRIIEQYPMLEVPLGDLPPPMLAFDVAAEVVLLERFKNACIQALIASMTETITTQPRMSQLLEYELHDTQRDYIHKVVNRIPELLKALVGSITQISVRDFRDSSLMLAALGHLNAISPASGGVGRLPYHQAWIPNISGGDAMYLFDYFSSSGSVLRLSAEPLAVLLTKCVGGQYRCRFARVSQGSGSRSYERYLPGECYAYICIGFNREFRGIIVFPGGFAFHVTPADHLIWPAHLFEAILSRFCWSIPPTP
ncbi:DNA packaging tegument protein UL17 [Felid alphaherpesvirus 1]|uniref:DNA packaging tegument protein UL17 n=1 Tax=Feline herpesvirus 1 TaxID=10334 RepID=Q769E7_FHV1|nr:DNA packaging tegument protein UL17 [Felid alphaherpesvirus 1]AMN88976.1 DNA packaging tegument protein UL17 [synthetic construct]ACT88341.1 DNA packaging tegument protein UL17 [Felid alphaherpesvirus 1]ALJ84074.1 DNA packaging tegument protein UL17 [Felid alphaherpesvirus 1]ALJ84150.1 DNA packaging tegument protein UL17 [Felid alphaherpesvirus 1]ALJ84226.1 DNA packaging tegument protein UL17 [Felid alphaherpesvirus 1]